MSRRPSDRIIFLRHCLSYQEQAAETLRRTIDDMEWDGRPCSVSKIKLQEIRHKIGNIKKEIEDAQSV